MRNNIRFLRTVSAAEKLEGRREAFVRKNPHIRSAAGRLLSEEDFRGATSSAMDKLDGIITTVYKRAVKSTESKGVPSLSDIRDAATNEFYEMGKEIVNKWCINIFLVWSLNAYRTIFSSGTK